MAKSYCSLNFISYNYVINPVTALFILIRPHRVIGQKMTFDTVGLSIFLINLFNFF